MNITEPLFNTRQPSRRILYMKDPNQAVGIGPGGLGVAKQTGGGGSEPLDSLIERARTDDEALDAVLDIFKSRDREKRRIVIKYLGDIDSPRFNTIESIASLTKVLEDKDDDNFTARLKALQILGQIDTVEAFKPIIYYFLKPGRLKLANLTLTELDKEIEKIVLEKIKSLKGQFLISKILEELLDDEAFLLSALDISELDRNSCYVKVSDKFNERLLAIPGGREITLDLTSVRQQPHDIKELHTVKSNMLPEGLLLSMFSGYEGYSPRAGDVIFYVNEWFDQIGEVSDLTCNIATIRFQSNGTERIQLDDYNKRRVIKVVSCDGEKIEILINGENYTVPYQAMKVIAKILDKRVI